MKTIEIELPKSEYSDQTTGPASNLSNPMLAALNDIRDRIKSRNQNYEIETGRDLLRAKKLLPHGEFGPWLKVNFDWSLSTAQNYMNAAKLAEKYPEVERLAPAAAIALAAPNTPETVKSEIVADLKAGKVPSTKTIKEKIAEAKAPKPAKAKEASSATVAQLPVNLVDEGTVKPAHHDLVERLKAVGIEVARDAFEAAYPGYTFTDFDELEASIAMEAKRRAA